jgi:hypothetical protein
MVLKLSFCSRRWFSKFENDVEMYGAQIYFSNGVFTIGYRDWAPEHEKMGKGVTLTEDEMMKLKELL